MGILLRWQQPPVETSWNNTEIQRSINGIDWTPLVTLTDITTTSYYDDEGNSTTYYRMRFTDTVATTVSTWSEPVLGNEVGGYCSVQELRKFMQFGRSNNPSTEDISFLIQQSKVQVDTDIQGTETEEKKKLLHLWIAKAYVFRSLASRGLRFGYVEMNIDGNNVRKAHTELLADAKESELQYDNILNRETTEVAITSPLRNLDSDTQKDIIDIFHGTSDGEDYEDQLAQNLTRRRGDS